MLSLALPWFLVLLPLPLLVRRFAPTHRDPREGLRVPFMDRLESATGARAAAGAAVARARPLQTALTWTCWALLVLALARPQWLGETLEKTVPSRDLLLAVDLSASMSAKDFTAADGQDIDRLTAVKEVLDDFLTRREDDRVGLVLFGSAAFVQVPFTDDVEVCRQLLNEAQVGMAGPKTAIGDAIGLAITVFERGELDERLMILLTDGNDSGSKVPPDKAARLAADYGIEIHTIAVGDPAAVGEEEIDETALKDISATTGGTFYRASDRAGLAGIYNQIDALGTRETQVLTHRPTTDLYHWPLGVAVGIILLFHGIAAARATLRRHGRADEKPDKTIANGGRADGV